MSDTLKQFIEFIVKNNFKLISLTEIPTVELKLDDQYTDDDCKTLREGDIWLVKMDGVIYLVLDNAFIEIGLDLETSLLVNLNKDTEFYLEELVKQPV